MKEKKGLEIILRKKFTEYQRREYVSKGSRDEKEKKEWR